jgi:hypothetical protein
MSDSLAVVSVVGLVMGTTSVTVLGLLCVLRDKTLRLKVGRANVNLALNRGGKRR